jgi:hypothetical protein
VYWVVVGLSVPGMTALSLAAGVLFPQPLASIGVVVGATGGSVLLRACSLCWYFFLFLFLFSTSPSPFPHPLRVSIVRMAMVVDGTVFFFCLSRGVVEKCEALCLYFLVIVFFLFFCSPHPFLFFFLGGQYYIIKNNS